MPGQHLRTRMIDGDECPSVPTLYFPGCFFQREFMIVNALERIKGHRSKRYNHARIYQFDRASQKPGTIRNLLWRRFAICPRRSLRVAERGTGNEDLIAA